MEVYRCFFDRRPQKTHNIHFWLKLGLVPMPAPLCVGSMCGRWSVLIGSCTVESSLGSRVGFMSQATSLRLKDILGKGKGDSECQDKFFLPSTALFSLC